MIKTTKSDKILQSDVMRYKTNKFSSNFTLLGIAFGCLYFLVLYGQYTKVYDISTLGELYYNIQIGLSVIYELVFLLIGFLASLQVKAYQKKAPYILFVLALIQFLRIFWLPLRGYNAMYLGEHVVPASSFAYMVVWLCLSTICLVVAGVYGIIINKQYYDYKKQLEAGAFNIDSYLKELDAKEEAEAQAKAEELVEQEVPIAEKPVAEDSAEPDAAKEE